MHGTSAMAKSTCRMLNEVEFTCRMLNGDIIAHVAVEPRDPLRKVKRAVVRVLRKSEYELHLIVVVGDSAQEVSELDKSVTVGQMSELNGTVLFRNQTQACFIEALLNADRGTVDKMFHTQPDFLDNYEPMLTAIRDNVYALDLIPASLKESRDFMLAAVKRNGSALGVAAPSVAEDPEVTLAAIQQNVYALRYAPQVFRESYDFMLAAVRQNAQALYYASEKLKSNDKFLLAALQQDHCTLQYAPKRFQAKLSKGELRQPAARSLLHGVFSQNNDLQEHQDGFPQTSRILEDATHEPRKDLEKQVLAPVKVCTFDF